MDQHLLAKTSQLKPAPNPTKYQNTVSAMNSAEAGGNVDPEYISKISSEISRSNDYMRNRAALKPGILPKK